MAGSELVQRFRGLRTLVIGDALLDTYLEGTAARLCSEGPVPVVRKTAEERAPGGAGNTAANLCSLGADVMFLGVVGSDTAGQELRQAVRERGVDDRWLVEDVTAATQHKVRILADDQYVVRFDSGDSQGYGPGTYQRLLCHLDEAFAQCDLVVVSDYCHGAVTDDIVERLTALRHDKPCPLLVDSKNLRRFARAGATVLTPNHLEARLVAYPSDATSTSVDVEEVVGIARTLLGIIDSEHVAVTMASDGVVLASRDGATHHLPSYPVPRANDVGAGDSFTAAMGLALAAGGSVVKAAEIGIEAGRLAVTKRRTASVSLQELLQRVSAHERASTRSTEALVAALQEERSLGRSLVFTNGVFDILHAGHVHFLRQAKQLGDILVVGVNSDRSARLLKGKNRPINREQDRMALVAALDPVDHVVAFDEATPANLIRALRPDLHVKGGDYVGETLPEEDAVEEVGGRIVILPLVESLSTSLVIERILTLAMDAEVGVAS